MRWRKRPLILERCSKKSLGHYAKPVGRQSRKRVRKFSTECTRLPSDTTDILHQLDLYNERRLPSGTGLFERGKPNAALDETGFILRVNREVFNRGVLPRTGRAHHKVRMIGADGRLGPHAELVVFGTWLILHQMPGSMKRSGKRPDLRKVLKVAAAAFAALLSREKPRTNDPVTTKDVARLWRICFQEATTTAAHSSSLRTLRIILPEYLVHLKAAHVVFKGVPVTGSPGLKRLAKALETGIPATKAPAPAPTPAATAPGVTQPGVFAVSLVASSHAGAPVTSFEITLAYSSPAAEVEYRNLPQGSVPATRLHYDITSVQATNHGHQLRADRAGRVVFVPDFDIGQVRVKALLDRIAFTFTTRCKVDHNTLQKAIQAANGHGVYVADRTSRANDDSDWLACLPELDLSQTTGYHFAVHLQDPTPTRLRAALDAADSVAGIDGAVRPCLLELAIDFYPRSANDPIDALLIREQIVGLAQRHIWSDGSRLASPDGRPPRQKDPRQVYQEGTLGQMRYLFPDKADRYHSDRDLKETRVRQRLLTARSGNDLYLNATIYRGDKGAPLRVNVQHKIADRRHIVKGAKHDLAAEERRARVEVTLTSLEELQNVGLKTLDDLSNAPLRRMIRKLLTFRLATCATDNHAINETIACFRNRGVYGIEMSQRARLHEDRIGQTPRPRNTDREGFGLTDWTEMNALVGDAVDRLMKTWRRF